MRPYLIIATALFLTACSARRCMDPAVELASIHIIDRNGLTETISTPERLNQYAQVDFLKPQSYQKVLRVFGRDSKGNIRSYVTSYHENGQPKQYLEILNTRAMGSYREWYSNGTMRIDAFVIGGDADITAQAEKSWLFDGPARAWNECGILLANVEYQKGELHGISTYYHDNGTISKTIPYCLGKAEGTAQIFDPCGNLIEAAEFANGVPHGRTIRFWSPGQTTALEEFQEGLLARGRYWEQNGQLVSEINEGSGFRTLFSPDGRSEQQEYKNGQLEGIVKVFNKEGFVVRTYHIKDEVKHGEEVEYFTNPLARKASHPKLSLHWSEGKIQGVVKTWYDNGAQESQREISNNRKHGLSTAWYRDGSIMLIEEYEQDKLVNGQYFKKGDSRPISKIKKGEGEASLYGADGSFMQKVTYVNGQPEV